MRRARGVVMRLWGGTWNGDRTPLLEALAGDSLPRLEVLADQMLAVGRGRHVHQGGVCGLARGGGVVGTCAWGWGDLARCLPRICQHTEVEGGKEQPQITRKMRRTVAVATRCAPSTAV